MGALSQERRHLDSTAPPLCPRCKATATVHRNRHSIIGECTSCGKLFPLKADSLPKRTKYNNARCTDEEGRTFDSLWQREVAARLRQQERLGIIFDLEYEKKFPLVVNGVHICDFYPDFIYKDEDGNPVAVDAKGVETRVAKQKAQIFLALYGIPLHFWKKKEGMAEVKKRIPPQAPTSPKAGRKPRNG